MDYEQQLKLQAYLDGELSGAEARQVGEWVTRDHAAAALLAELRQTGAALKGFEAELRLPESRDFYWSRIQGAIERQEASARQKIGERPWLLALRRLLVPVTGLAVVIAFTVVGLRHTGGSPAEDSVTTLEDVQAFTYHDFSAGATLVWLSYPADMKIAGEDELTILD